VHVTQLRLGTSKPLRYNEYSSAQVTPAQIQLITGTFSS
jgi:hypothetical protein